MAEHDDLAVVARLEAKRLQSFRIVGSCVKQQSSCDCYSKSRAKRVRERTETVKVTC